MASVFFRGPKSAPKWYARYKDPSGKWISRRVRQETRREAMRVAVVLEAKAERQKFGLEAPDSAGLLFRDLAQKWAAGLVNRSAADDRCRLRLHVLPRFGALRLSEVTLAALMAWLDDEQAARPRRMSSSTLRHCLNIVSRLFGWAIERGFAQVNPCRQIPSGRRPHHAPKKLMPWLEDDATVRELIAILPEPVNLMFFLGNRSGLRLGEICGLRLSDLDTIDAGAIRVRYSYNGPLKEDRHATGKVKWAPAPDDARAVLGAWLTSRAGAGAQLEDYLFPDENGRHFRKEFVEYRWNRAAAKLAISFTWYQATRHAFASRSLSRGVPIDQVAAALGHSTSAITARHYAHFVRKTFAPLMTLSLDAAGGKVIPIASPRPPVPPPAPTAPEEAESLRLTGTARGGRG